MKAIVSPQNLHRSKQRKAVLKNGKNATKKVLIGHLVRGIALWQKSGKIEAMPDCEKYIEKQPKTSQNSLFSAVFWSE